MARRRSLNRRASRKSMNITELDQDSELIDTDDPMWWKNIEGEITMRQSRRTSNGDTTDPILNVDSFVDSSELKDEWWKKLDKTNNEETRRISTRRSLKPVDTPYESFNSDETEKISSIKKRKVLLRARDKKSVGTENFMAALDDLRRARKSDSSREKTRINGDNDETPMNGRKRNRRSVNDDGTRKNTGETSENTSTDTDIIVKSRPKVYKKGFTKISDSPFDDILRHVNSGLSVANEPNDVSLRVADTTTSKNPTQQRAVFTSPEDSFNDLEKTGLMGPPKNLSHRKRLSSISRKLDQTSDESESDVGLRKKRVNFAKKSRNTASIDSFDNVIRATNVNADNREIQDPSMRSSTTEHRDKERRSENFTLKNSSIDVSGIDNLEETNRSTTSSLREKHGNTHVATENEKNHATENFTRKNLSSKRSEESNKRDDKNNSDKSVTSSPLTPKILEVSLTRISSRKTTHGRRNNESEDDVNLKEDHVKVANLKNQLSTSTRRFIEDLAYELPDKERSVTPQISESENEMEKSFSRVSRNNEKFRFSQRSNRDTSKYSSVDTKINNETIAGRLRKSHGRTNHSRTRIFSDEDISVEDIDYIGRRNEETGRSEGEEIRLSRKNVASENKSRRNYESDDSTVVNQEEEKEEDEEEEEQAKETSSKFENLRSREKIRKSRKSVLTIDDEARQSKGEAEMEMTEIVKTTEPKTRVSLRKYFANKSRYGQDELGVAEEIRLSRKILASENKSRRNDESDDSTVVNREEEKENEEEEQEEEEEEEAKETSSKFENLRSREKTHKSRKSVLIIDDDARQSKGEAEMEMTEIVKTTEPKTRVSLRKYLANKSRYGQDELEVAEEIRLSRKIVASENKSRRNDESDDSTVVNQEEEKEEEEEEKEEEEEEAKETSSKFENLRSREKIRRSRKNVLTTDDDARQSEGEAEMEMTEIVKTTEPKTRVSLRKHFANKSRYDEDELSIAKKIVSPNARSMEKSRTSLRNIVESPNKSIRSDRQNEKFVGFGETSEAKEIAPESRNYRSREKSHSHERISQVREENSRANDETSLNLRLKGKSLASRKNSTAEVSSRRDARSAESARKIETENDDKMDEQSRPRFRENSRISGKNFETKKSQRSILSDESISDDRDEDAEETVPESGNLRSREKLILSGKSVAMNKSQGIIRADEIMSEDEIEDANMSDGKSQNSRPRDISRTSRKSVATNKFRQSVRSDESISEDEPEATQEMDKKLQNSRTREISHTSRKSQATNKSRQSVRSDESISEDEPEATQEMDKKLQNSRTREISHTSRKSQATNKSRQSVRSDESISEDEPEATPETDQKLQNSRTREISHTSRKSLATNKSRQSVRSDENISEDEPEATPETDQKLQNSRTREISHTSRKSLVTNKSRQSVRSDEIISEDEPEATQETDQTTQNSRTREISHTSRKSLVTNKSRRNIHSGERISVDEANNLEKSYSAPTKTRTSGRSLISITSRQPLQRFDTISENEDENVEDMISTSEPKNQRNDETRKSLVASNVGKQRFESRAIIDENNEKNNENFDKSIGEKATNARVSKNISKNRETTTSRGETSFSTGLKANEASITISSKLSPHIAKRTSDKNFTPTADKNNVSRKQKNITDFFPSKFLQKTNNTSTRETTTSFDKNKLRLVEEKIAEMRRREIATMRLQSDAKKRDENLGKRHVEALRRKKSPANDNAAITGKITRVIDKAYIVNGKVYKRPKLPRPKPWVTDRLYRHLWKKMEPKYKLSTRVKSEKFIQQLSEIVAITTRRKKYDSYKLQVDDLMREMARLGIVKTRNDFYDFCYDFLPYDFRVKVTPILLPGNIHSIPYDPAKLNEPILRKGA